MLRLHWQGQQHQWFCMSGLHVMRKRFSIQMGLPSFRTINKMKLSTLGLGNQLFQQFIANKTNEDYIHEDYNRANCSLEIPHLYTITVLGNDLRPEGGLHASSSLDYYSSECPSAWFWPSFSLALLHLHCALKLCCAKPCRLSYRC